MVRIFRGLIGCVVTGITIFGGIAKLAVEVTGGTIILNVCMSAG